jgi:hypothetical protein
MLKGKMLGVMEERGAPSSVSASPKQLLYPEDGGNSVL